MLLESYRGVRMAMTKISATLSPDLVEAVRRRAGPRGVSAWLDAAVREKLDREEHRAGVLALIAELDEEDPPTEEDRRRAEQWFAQVEAKFEAREGP